MFPITWVKTRVDIISVIKIPTHLRVPRNPIIWDLIVICMPTFCFLSSLMTQGNVKADFAFETGFYLT